jgi:alpha-mannosidase
VGLKDKTLYMIGNAHIDPVWLWRWDEGFQEVRATFRSALDRMNEFDDFVFTASSAALYEWVEHSDPAMFAEIRQRVAEGRWQIIGGWWMEPDCNIPSGESFVRQGLYGQRYFKEKFGVTARIGYNPDSFGHNGALPQILKKSGLDSYIFMRPGPHEKALPAHLFWWEADDGSRVLAFRIHSAYCACPADISQHVLICADAIKAPFDSTLCFYGVGNHGGGPTVANLECIRRMDANPEFPHLVLGGAEKLLDPKAAQAWPLPVVHDELQHHASGCYSAHSGIKRWNRQAENLLLAAEKWAVIAQRVTGQPYPTGLDRAWKNVLFNQFHDTLAGTAIEAAYEDARDLYGEAQAIGGRALNYALQALAWNVRVEPQEGMKPIVVFNPHAWPVRTNVELEYGDLHDGDGLQEESGRPVALQTVQSWAAANGRSRLSFLAELPPLGYRTYRVAPGTAAGKAHEADGSSTAGRETAEAAEHVLENGRFRLEIDPLTGYIASLRDKQAGCEVFTSEAAVPLVIDDPSDTWSHNVFKFDHVCGAFRASRVQLVECGPVKSVLRVTSEYAASRLVQDFTLYRDLEQIDVHVTVDWHEHFKMLKLRFPAHLHSMKATYEVPYGHMQRFASGEEEAGQGWVDLSGLSRDTGDLYGVSILNDGKYSFDVNIRDIGLTVLRSPVYANHMPVVPVPGKEYSFIDQGIQRFTYSILPHTGGWEEAGTVRRAAELNQRPLTLPGATQPGGKLPQSASFLSVDRENVDVSVLKQAEENDDLILRAYETAGVAGRATLCLGAPLGDRTVVVDFGACEIKTLRIPRDPAQPVLETNLLEWQE